MVEFASEPPANHEMLRETRGYNGSVRFFHQAQGKLKVLSNLAMGNVFIMFFQADHKLAPISL